MEYGYKGIPPTLIIYNSEDEEVISAELKNWNVKEIEDALEMYHITKDVTDFDSIEEIMAEIEDL